MHDPASTLSRFVIDYRMRAAPPPHILMVGPDMGRSEAVARSFAAQLKVGFHGNDAAKIATQGDLSALICGKRVVFISNIQLLNKTFAQKIALDVPNGHWTIQIGIGPAARTHNMDLDETVIIATVPTRYECPSILLKVFETVLTIDPPTEEELVEMLREEAWKDRIGMDRDAAGLLIMAANHRSDVMFSHFRRIRSVIEQIKNTNQPHLTRQEVEDALAKLRIKIPAVVSSTAAIDIHSLSGQEFEHLIKALLSEMGFEAELTGVTGDGGIDIIAKLDKPFVGGRYLFQCKRYATGNTVGAPEIRDFYGAVMADRAIKGVFITTSTFSSQAKEFAAQSGVELINLDSLLQLLESHGLNQYR